MRLRHLKEYAFAVGSTWVGLVSGIGSLVLFVLGITLAQAGLIGAFICLLIASFAIWHTNHPDLIIEIRGVVLDTNYGGRVTTSTSPLPQFVSLMLYLSNTRREDNSIKSYRLIVKGYGRKQEGDNVDVEGLYHPNTRETCTDLHKLRRTPLKQGVPVEGCVRFSFNGEPNIKGHTFTLIVVDAYNFSRQIKGTLPLEHAKGLIKVSTGVRELISKSFEPPILPTRLAKNLTDSARQLGHLAHSAVSLAYLFALKKAVQISVRFPCKTHPIFFTRKTTQTRAS